MNKRKKDYISLVLSPWSLWLKEIIREHSPDFTVRLSGYRGKDYLLPAWLFWLLDGDEVAAKEILRISTAVSSHVNLRIMDGDSPIYEIDFHNTSDVKVADFSSGENIPRAFPEGDGLYYHKLEISEQGESRVLPGEVIDEAFIFADSVIKSFNRKV